MVTGESNGRRERGGDSHRGSSSVWHGRRCADREGSPRSAASPHAPGRHGGSPSRRETKASWIGAEAASMGGVHQPIPQGLDNCPSDSSCHSGLADSPAPCATASPPLQWHCRAAPPLLPAHRAHPRRLRPRMRPPSYAPAPRPAPAPSKDPRQLGAMDREPEDRCRSLGDRAMRATIRRPMGSLGAEDSTSEGSSSVPLFVGGHHDLQRDASEVIHGWPSDLRWPSGACGS